MRIAALTFAVVAASASAATQTPFGTAGDPAKVTRTVTVDMSDDIRFMPAALDMKRGDTVRFVVVNKGALPHELVLGTKKTIAEHAEAMKQMQAGHAHHVHASPGMVSLAPGKTGEIVWRFDRAGTFDYACLVPGHLEAGMKGTIVVK